MVQSNLRRMASREGVLRVALVWSLLLGAPFPALAQSAGPSLIDLADMSLEELLRIEVTTASKKPESLLDAPAIMLVLTESDINAYGGRSLVEILDRTTSVFFMGNQENLQGALTMRGDATLGANNHILVLVNGRPIQESTHGGMIHPFLRSFPLASVKQIEIVRGPGSVLYGTNAYVGVINVITKTWDSSGVAGVSYGAFDTGTASAAGGKTIGRLHVSGGINFSHDTGWNFNATDSIDEGKAIATTRNVPWFDRKVGANLNATYGRVNLDVFYAHSESPHLSNSSATTSWARYGTSRATQAMVDLGYTRKLSTRWTSSLHGTYNHFLDHADFGEIGHRITQSNNYLLEWANNLSVSDTVNTVFGANVSRRTGSFYEETYLWYAVPSYRRNSFTAFAQADYRPMPRLKLIAGGQVIKVPGFSSHVSGGESGEVSQIAGIAPHFVGRLGAVVTMTNNFGAKLLYSEAFRQPSVVETDLVRFDEGDFSQEGNPDLRPEEISTTDFQIYYSKDRVNAAVTLFDSRQSNVIAETDDFDLIQNFDRFQTRGMEIEARVRPMKNVELISAVTYQRLQNDTAFDRLAIPVPRFMGKFGVSYRTESGLTAGLHDSYFGTPRESSNVSEDLSDTTQYVNPTASAFHNVTLSVAQRFGNLAFLPGGRDLTARVHVNNLLNEGIYYAEYTSVNVNSLPGRPGRAVFVGVTVGF
jgi:outer membrane receptor for ferrienterochelin and colicins